MTPEEVRNVAQQVLAHIAGESAIKPSTNDLTVEPNALQCFTCSGKFKCRPSFIVKDLEDAGSD